MSEATKRVNERWSPRFLAAFAGLLLCLPVSPCWADTPDPDFYVRKSDWHASLLASLEAIAQRGLEDGFEPFESGTMKGGDPARAIRVPLRGATELYLLVTGVPDVRWAVADWADARIIRDDGSAQWVSESARAVALLGRWEKDITLKSGLYQKLELNGRIFEHGLNVQADSIIHLPLEGASAWFEATIGVDDWAGNNGTVRFAVLGARSAAVRRLWVPLMRDFGTGPQRQQMNWEREDRIFECAWHAGQWQMLARRYAHACERVPPLAREAAELAATLKDQTGLDRIRQTCYLRSRSLEASLDRARRLDFDAPRAALADLVAEFPDAYPATNVAHLANLQQAVERALKDHQPDRLESWTAVEDAVARFEDFQRSALLANPLLDFESLLVLKRVPLGGARRTNWEGYGHGEYLGVPRQSSWNYGTMPNVENWTNEIAVLSPVRTDGPLVTLYRPPGTRLVNDIELHWDAHRLLFSMPDAHRNWQVHELMLDPATRVARLPSRQLTPELQPDVHNYDAIYLPNDEILFLSTAPLQGVPCNAGVIVGMMYKMGPDGKNIRQITFEQDHDYTPSVLNDGRVLYLRWDYTDTPHVWNRLLMSMNPDGSAQMEYTGANSYWPNAMFFARAVPDHPTKIATIVTGHHEGRIGELFLFDPARGRRETEGVVQRIPQSGPPVLPKIEDKLTEHSWPKFLHPWPLSQKYFLVSCKPEPDALWGIYLVDVFDNRVLLKEEEGVALLEPVPLRARPRPPVISERVRPDRTDALVYMEDVYSGPGLKGVPRGTVKNLRLFTYHFGYQRLAGIDHRVGADGPWEAKRVLGTVPVEADGSAFFRIPAKTPISVQPLDADGSAVALMRSWMTAMPGENVSCVGCHDHPNSVPSGTGRRIALASPPRTITPWHGPSRGFSFAREVQPVLDKYCVSCHDGATGPKSAEPDLRRDQGGFVVYRGGELDGKFIPNVRQELLGKFGAVFDPSYVALRAFVRVGGLESDLHLLPPREFAADTSELVRMLVKGHHNVKMDAQAWDRIFTWIDLNAPCHGTWSETAKIPGDQCRRRLELRTLYGGIVENDEEVPDVENPSEPVIPEAEESDALVVPALEGWPFDATAATSLQAACGTLTRSLDLGHGVTLELVRIPPGSFIMGDPKGTPDERPLAAMRIEKSFWMARFEVSNEQFAIFDPAHDSRFEHRSSWWFDEEYIGWPLDGPQQPVVRVSWEESMAFCRWLSGKIGENVTLPTESQWEWACRAGSETPFFFGGLETDFSPYGNMGDASLRKLADEGWRPKSPDLVPMDGRFNDGALVTCTLGRYAPNAWGLYDTHGNVAEWTRSDYQSYRCRADDGGDAAETGPKTTIRGGSWRDRPHLCRSASRWGYAPWQKVFNVGFRIIIESETSIQKTTP
ncbi:MAG: SUMF1/EgtB/PvdO family nonheme iron enzyme [Pirellulaceae bacterium]